MGVSEPTNKTNWYDWNTSDAEGQDVITEEKFLKSIFGGKKNGTWFS